MTDKPFIKQYTLSDLFDGTFKMLKHTWKNSLIVSVPVFLIVSLAFALAMGPYFNTLSRLYSGEFLNNLPENLISLIPLMVSIFVIGIIGGMLTLFARAVIVLTTFRAANNETTDIKALLLIVAREKFGKLILQTLLVIAIFFGGYIAVALALGITIGIFSLVSKVMALIIAGIGVIAVICVIFWISISFGFIQEDIIFGETRVVQSIKNSFKLVNMRWWRVFGYRIVFSLALSFAVSVFTSPIMFSFMLPYYTEMIEQLINNPSGFQMNRMYEIMATMYSKAIIPIFISYFLSSVAAFLISPVFTGLFYIDVKVRSGDIKVEPESPSEEGVVGLSGDHTTPPE
jgi:hypothetical protein